MFLRFLIVFIIVLLVEVYFLQAVRTFARDFSPERRKVLVGIAIGLAALNGLLAISAMIWPPPTWPAPLRMFMGILFILTLCKLIGVLFLIMDDVVRFFKWIVQMVGTKPAEETTSGGISRLKFFSQLAIGFTVIPAIGFIYGIVKGAYRYRIHNVQIPSANLPAEFDGFKIVQLSDIHTGSFNDDSALRRAFSLVLEQKPDLILFTGDLVNNEAKETEGYTDAYKMLKAPYGVYSVLGNHDYGDYISWESDQAKQANLERLKAIQKECGWRLLMNEHVAIEKEGAKIGLLGIENWGGNMNFPKYGKMDEATKGADVYPFKILMSHDPSHWEQKVSQIYKDIDLTLSGHTHGMQMGIEIPGLKWSPSQYFYKYWAGLYKQDHQFLYVNRGLGFLGYPGRIGIWPEITVMELKKA